MSTAEILDSISAFRNDEAHRRYRAHPERSGPLPEVDERLDRVEIDRERITFHLKDGRVVTVPLAWSWRLMQATEEELQDFEVGTYVVHWPAVDEDLSGRGALRGTPAPRPGSRPGLKKWREEQRSRSEALWDAPRIKQLRQRLDLSQEDMAERMGVRQATISDWERANQKPSPMACRLLDMLRSGQA